VGLVSSVGDHIMQALCRGLTLPDSEATKLPYHPKQNLGKEGPQRDKHLPQSLFTGNFFYR
jgi:hypothetical protein